MNLILLLVLLGTVLLAAEVFLPGAICGIIGGLSLIAACVVAGMHYGAVGALLTFLGAALITSAAFYFEFRVLPKTAFGRKMFVESSIEGTSQPPVAGSSIVGKTGKALTPLSPTGVVLIDGRKYEAFSQSGLIAKSAEVRVHSVDNFRIIVTLSCNYPSSSS